MGYLKTQKRHINGLKTGRVYSMRRDACATFNGYPSNDRCQAWRSRCFSFEAVNNHRIERLLKLLLDEKQNEIYAIFLIHTTKAR